MADGLPEVTREDAVEAMQDMATDLYRAQDRVALVREMLDAHHGPLDAERVRAWLDQPVCPRAESEQQTITRLEAAVARVRALAVDMRDWCSPHGIATSYAERIEEALDGRDSLTPAPESATAQTGVDTDGCDCGHDGMGFSWHASDCAWRPDRYDAMVNAPLDPAAVEALRERLVSGDYARRKVQRRDNHETPVDNPPASADNAANADKEQR